MQFQPTSKPLILLLGQTGSGKSTFISTVGATSVLHPGQTPKVGHGLSSCTKGLEEYAAIFPKDTKKSVQLVDTPGFDDDELNQGDCDKLRIIIDWLKVGPVLIIYLLDITQCRLTTSSGTMGPTKISRPPGVVFVTTKRNQINGKELQNREKLLESSIQKYVHLFIKWSKVRLILLLDDSY
ncbi:hypothetical protein BJ912DRAFT_975828 [Pholiota molesta]|nr:hypothetical protein BJ912DRAFT_975828 [Pholiota molesta]